MTDRRSTDAARALRVRLLTSLGLGMLPLSGCWPKCEPWPPDVVTVDLADFESHSDPDVDSGIGPRHSDDEDTDTDIGGDTDPVGDTDAAKDTDLDTDVSRQAPPPPYSGDSACPTDESAIFELLERATDGDLSCRDEVRLTGQAGSVCTYEVTCFRCCAYGRPLIDEGGAPVKADAARVEGWTDGADHPALDALTDDERAAIGAFWRDNARAEHSSVAGFHRFALDLLAHGAPPELIDRAQRAAAQELRHALACFSLASAYLGEPVGPAPMALGGQVPIAKSLAELAAWTARDGAIGETLAAHLAERALADATDPAVRAVLAEIVRDETEHAELAWATLRWAVDVGGDAVRDAALAVFAEVGDLKPHAIPWTARLAAHGVPDPAREVEEARRALAEVVTPVAEAVFDARRAA